jgi:hypothetical protein
MPSPAGRIGTRDAAVDTGSTGLFTGSPEAEERARAFTQAIPIVSGTAATAPSALGDDRRQRAAGVACRATDAAGRSLTECLTRMT